jgi:hypothetical protein
LPSTSKRLGKAKTALEDVCRKGMDGGQGPFWKIILFAVCGCGKRRGFLRKSCRTPLTDSDMKKAGGRVPERDLPACFCLKYKKEGQFFSFLPWVWPASLARRSRNFSKASP